MLRLLIDLKQNVICTLVQGSQIVTTFELQDNDLNTILKKIGLLTIDEVGVYVHPEVSVELPDCMEFGSLSYNDNIYSLGLYNTDLDILKDLCSKLGGHPRLLLYSAIDSILQISQGLGRMTYLDHLFADTFRVLTVEDGACLYVGEHTTDEICEIQKVLDYPFTIYEARQHYIVNIETQPSEVRMCLQYVDLIFRSEPVCDIHLEFDVAVDPKSEEVCDITSSTIDASVENLGEVYTSIVDTNIIQASVQQEPELTSTEEEVVLSELSKVIPPKKMFKSINSLKQNLLFYSSVVVVSIVMSVLLFANINIPDINILQDLRMQRLVLQQQEVLADIEYYNYLNNGEYAQTYVTDMSEILDLGEDAIISSVRFVDSTVELSIIVTDDLRLQAFLGNLPQQYTLSSYMMESELAASGDSVGLIQYLVLLTRDYNI